MSIVNIKKALEKHLAGLLPKIATAHEGVSYVPENGVAYQRVVVVPRKPLNPTMGDDYYRDIGELQVFLAYPTAQGTGEVLARAELIRTHFKRATTLVEGDSRVLIVRTPQIVGTTTIGDRVIVPVIIEYSSEVI